VIKTQIIQFSQAFWWLHPSLDKVKPGKSLLNKSIYILTQVKNNTTFDDRSTIFWMYHDSSAG